MINTFFEERLEQLFDLLDRAKALFDKAGVEYRVIGGLAVYLHVSCIDESAGRLTRDVDVSLKRTDLDRLVPIAREFGFEYRHVAGVDMLVDAVRPSARRAVHLVFAGEKVKAGSIDSAPDFSRNPDVCRGAFVAPIPDLLRMKLTSFRDKDRVHVRDLDEVGLITPDVEATLPEVLRVRLAEIRATE
jgi:hypothetical protein